MPPVETYLAHLPWGQRPDKVIVVPSLCLPSANMRAAVPCTRSDPRLLQQPLRRRERRVGLLRVNGTDRLEESEQQRVLLMYRRRLVVC